MPQIQAFAEKVVPNIEKVIVGKRNSVELAVIGMLCQGHLLIEDVSISEGACIMERVNQMLVERFNIRHSTLQLECDQCAEGQCLFHASTHGGKVLNS